MHQRPELQPATAETRIACTTPSNITKCKKHGRKHRETVFVKLERGTRHNDDDGGTTPAKKISKMSVEISTSTQTSDATPNARPHAP